MAQATAQGYGNESITQLKGADRVRKRPGVIILLVIKYVL